MASKNKKSRLMIRLLKAPIRILAGARDFYVQSLTECSGHVAMGCPTGQIIATLPRSFSVSSSSRSHVSSHEDDFRELVRAASANSLSSIRKHEPSDIYKISDAPPVQRRRRRHPNLMPRSLSSGIGRIDEEEPCEFREDAEVRAGLLHMRSRSCAVTRGSSAGLP